MGREYLGARSGTVPMRTLEFPTVFISLMISFIMSKYWRTRFSEILSFSLNNAVLTVGKTMVAWLDAYKCWASVLTLFLSGTLSKIRLKITRFRLSLLKFDRISLAILDEAPS